MRHVQGKNLSGVTQVSARVDLNSVSWTPDLCFQILSVTQIPGQNPKFKHGRIWTKIGKGLEKNTWDLNTILLDFKDLFTLYQASILYVVKLLCLK